MTDGKRAWSTETWTRKGGDDIDLANAIIRGFEIGIGIVAALAVLLVVNIAIIIIQSVIEVCAERKNDEDTK